MFRPRLSSWAVLGLLAFVAPWAHAQTLVWIGGFPDENFSSATNWSVVPVNDGTETLAFAPGVSQRIVFDVPVNLLEITVDGNDVSGENAIIGGTQPLALGSGGLQINSLGGEASSLVIAGPVVIASPQTWNLNVSGGALTLNGAVSGTASVTLIGASGTTFTLGSGASTFTGGTTLAGVGTTLVVNAGTTGPGDLTTQGPVGTGTLTLGSGTQMTSAPTQVFSVQSSNLGTGTTASITISNTIVAGDTGDSSTVTFGGNTQSGNTQPVNLVLTGTMTAFNLGETYQIGPNSNVVFQGPLNTSAADTLTFTSQSIPGTSSVADVQSPISSNYTSLALSGGVSVILDGSGPSQISGISSFSFASPQTYLGFGANYATSGALSGVIAQLNSTSSSAAFEGTLGLDSTTGTPTTFNDSIDLSQFTNEGFVGLGSATASSQPGASSVIIGPSVTITPPGAFFPFGGGGGVLTVQAPLGETLSPRSLNLNAGNAPLTLILSGALTYTGGTNVDGGALIFDTPLPTTGALSLGQGSTGTGYIGSTVNSTITDGNNNIQTFVNEFSSATSGVIGFDSLTGTQRTVASAIDLSGLSPGVFLGSATDTQYVGLITPFGTTYQFAGVKGGLVEISSALSGANSVIVGLSTPLESFGSQSSVELNNANTYTGGTTLQNGFLYVANPGALGTGVLMAPDQGSEIPWSQILAAPAATPVSLANNIQIPATGLALNEPNAFSGVLAPGNLTLTGIISNFSSDQGQLGIFGPVDLEGANTYTGGTTVSTQGAQVTLGNDSALGTGPVTATGSTLMFTSATPQLPGGFSLLGGSSATFSGSPVIDALAMAEGSTLNFNGATASIIGMKSDEPGSGNTIALGTGTALTFEPLAESTDNSPDFHGVISGSNGSVEVAGGFSLNLAGPNTYGGGTLVDATAFVLASNNSALGTGAVTVNGTLATNSGVTLMNAVTVDSTGTLAGFGTYSPGGTVSIQGGASLVPGRAGITGANQEIPIAGLLSFGNTTQLNLGPTGSLTFALTDAGGTAGVGYGSISAAGGLNITATALNPFTITLVTFDPTTNLSGNALNFNSGSNFTWTLINTGTSPITNFNPAFFTIDHSQFTNPTGFGGFFLSKVGHSIDLNFTPVPEPSTWVLLATGLGACGAAFRRRRR